MDQLRILKDTFEKTVYPSGNTLTELASATQLDELVLQCWFKNQRVKRRKQLLQCQPSVALEAQNQTISVKEEETPLSVPSTNTHPLSPSIVNAYNHELPKTSNIEQSGGTGASVWNVSWDSQPHDLQQLCLSVFDPSWASNPSDIDQFIQQLVARCTKFMHGAGALGGRGVPQPGLHLLQSRTPQGMSDCWFTRSLWDWA
ncbi:paired-like homeodomain transcription factor LEUTX [Myotis yumanensis]|uniref:paired-like homeodomain transcription factor LEUTX n=1 Tax=Myotis yumanensis TaxID=159337 RepID=UPI0038D48909